MRPYLCIAPRIYGKFSRSFTQTVTPLVQRFYAKTQILYISQMLSARGKTNFTVTRSRYLKKELRLGKFVETIRSTSRQPMRAKNILGFPIRLPDSLFVPAKTKHRTTTLSLVKIYGSFHTNYNGFRCVSRYRSGNRSNLNSAILDYLLGILLLLCFQQLFTKNSYVYVRHL